MSGGSFQPAMRYGLMKCLCICHLGCGLSRGDLLECSLVGHPACQLHSPDVDQTLANPAPAGKRSSLEASFSNRRASAWPYLFPVG